MIRTCLICSRYFDSNKIIECCGVSFHQFYLPESHLMLLFDMQVQRDGGTKENTPVTQSKPKRIVVKVIAARRKRIEEIVKKKTRYRISDTIRNAVISRDESKCVECGCKEELHVHHKIHRKDGGTDELSNLVTLCELCHAEQHRGEPVYNIMIKRLFRYENIAG